MSFIPCNDREVIGLEITEIEITELTELVRGQEEELLERLTPLVRTQSVTLELSRVERIDAAGIAALIKLYRLALEASHSFTVSHARAHVAEILQLVGLERFLATPGADDEPCTSLSPELSAA